jgi:hypothetical protein
VLRVRGHDHVACDKGVDRIVASRSQFLRAYCGSANSRSCSRPRNRVPPMIRAKGHSILVVKNVRSLPSTRRVENGLPILIFQLIKQYCRRFQRYGEHAS